MPLPMELPTKAATIATIPSRASKIAVLRKARRLMFIVRVLNALCFARGDGKEARDVMGSGSGRGVVAGAVIPDGDGEGQEGRSNDRDERGVRRRDLAAEEADAWVKRGEAKGDDPAEEKLDDAAVNGERVAAEGDEVPNRRMDADAVFKPEADGAEQEEDRDVDDAGARAKESEQRDLAECPVEGEAVRRIPDTKDAGGYFLERFDAEGLEEHLEKGGDGTKQDAVEFSFNDVVVAEVVEIQADDVEDAVGDEREAVEEEDFFETPASEARGFLKEDNDEAKGKDGSGEAGGEADEEVAAVADTDFRILSEVVEEEERVAASSG